jgi:hypothetical protein
MKHEIDEWALFNQVATAKKFFGTKCSKYAGAVCVELIKNSLQQCGIATSSRDVFIDGVPIELDLLLPRYEAKAQYGLLYKPKDVLAVLEVKNSGSFGQSTIDRIKSNFEIICRSNPQIVCIYVTLTEGKTFRYRVTVDNIGADAYTLFWHVGAETNRRYEPTGDWAKLIDRLEMIAQAAG